MDNLGVICLNSEIYPFVKTIFPNIKFIKDQNELKEIEYCLFFEDFLSFNKSYFKQIREIIKSKINFIYLSNNKKIYLVHRDNIEITDKIDITRTDDVKEIFHENGLIQYDKEFENFLLSYRSQINYNTLFEKDIPAKSLTKFFENKPAYCMLVYINETNFEKFLLFKKPSYKHFRLLVLIGTLKLDIVESIEKRCNALKVDYLLIGRKFHLLPKIIANKLFYEERIIINNKLLAIDNEQIINYNREFKDYLIKDKITIVLPKVFIESRYLARPYFDTYNEVIEKIQSRLGKKEELEKYSELEGIQSLLLENKNYPRLLEIIQNLLDKNYDKNQIFRLITKKISMAILTDNEKIIEKELELVAKLTEQKLLEDIYVLCLSIKNKKLLCNLEKKILDISLEKDINARTVLVFKNLLNNGNHLPIFLTVMKAMEIFYEKNILSTEILKRICIQSFNVYLNFFDDAEANKAFSSVIEKILGISDMKNLQELINLNKNEGNNKLLIPPSFIIYLASNFSPYYENFDGFIKRRTEVKENYKFLYENYDTKFTIKDIWKVPVFNFHMSYQGIPSKDIFEIKAKFLRKVCDDLNFKIDTNFKNKKLKICFHANFLHRVHSVYKDRHQVIKNLSMDPRFEVYFSTYDPLNEEVKYSFGSAKHILLQKNLEGAKEALVKLKLDVLHFCEIGMCPLTYYLSYMKLAKVQTNTWGHSDSSGIDSIDYYISSKLFELPYEEAQENYSEKLILFNSLSTCYVKPISHYNIKSFKTRLSFGFTNDVVLFFCHQSLFKFNPKYDEYLIEILKRVPNGIIIMNRNEDLPKFLSRFDERDKEFGSIISRMHFINGMPHKDFMNLMNICDVILDPFPFGGCNSSLEAFSMHKPVVTQPSKMINGRFTQGFYKKMGLDKYISNSKEEYVNLAVRLAEDLEFRKTFEQDLKDNNDVLFNDQGTIDDYKEFLLGLKLT